MMILIFYLSEWLFHLDLYVVNDGDRPLQDDEIRKLRVLRPFLVDNICLDGLLDLLLARGCISRMHFDSIRQQADEYSKIREMLDILERRSYEQLKMFVSCLKSTHQEQIAQEIEGTGGEYCFFVVCFSIKIIETQIPIEHIRSKKRTLAWFHLENDALFRHLCYMLRYSRKHNTM